MNKRYKDSEDIFKQTYTTSINSATIGEDIFKQTYTTNINSATTGDLTSNSGSITTGTITADNIVYSPIQYGSYQKSDKEKVKNIMIDFLEWVLDKNEPENKDLFSLYWGIKRLDVKNV